MLEDEWKPAGGLFDVYVSYIDDYVDYGDSLPGNGFYKVSDSHEVTCASSDEGCTSTILAQDFTNAEHGTQLVAGIAGGSICRIILDDGLDSGQIASIRSTACHIRGEFHMCTMTHSYAVGVQMRMTLSVTIRLPGTPFLSWFWLS